MELLLQMVAWAFFCIIIIPTFMVAMIIFLWKMAHRPAPPRQVTPAKPAEPMVRRRWDGSRRSQVAHERLTWDRRFAEAQLQDRK